MVGNGRVEGVLGGGGGAGRCWSRCFFRARWIWRRRRRELVLT